MRRTAALVVAALIVSACASKGPPISEVDRRPHSIAIIPVLPADNVSIDRKSMWYMLYGGVGVLVERLDMMTRRKTFEQRFARAKDWIGPEVTEAIRAAAERRGLDAVVLNDLPRNPDDPEDFDYASIPTSADVIVQIRVKEIGLLSPRFSNDYVPAMELAGLAVVRRSGAVLLDENFQYGVNAKKSDVMSVAADPRYAFDRFDTVVEKIDLVEEGWHAGATALGDLVVQQIVSTRAH